MNFRHLLGCDTIGGIFRAEWTIPENIHTPHMDDIGNPVENA